MKAMIAMSGGVDSSVAALIIKQQQYECIGCTMKLFDNEAIGISEESTCCSLDDIADARAIADRLGMDYYVFNYCEGFRSRVMDKFADSYMHARTPNPCIDCNRYMKFEGLFKRARELDCDYIVTGHYARIEKDGDKFVLKKALDPSKDQSYVLYNMNQELLSHTLFPLGSLSKDETRRIAEENNFVNARKKDSQDICFVPNGDYASVIARITNGQTCPPGDFVLTDGTVIGRHKGIIHYTIGQRRGLGIAYKESLYVVRIDPEKNQVILGSNNDLFGRELIADDVNWISEELPSEPIRVTAKVRYRGKEEAATLTFLDDSHFKLVFDSPQRAITPGQSAVIYQGDTVLGGGIIM